MIKKEYQKPTMDVFEAELEDQLLTVSQIGTTGLDEGLTTTGGTGDMENDAMSRGNSVWGDED